MNVFAEFQIWKTGHLCFNAGWNPEDVILRIDMIQRF